jgi:DnaJ-class molecular chaperone
VNYYQTLGVSKTASADEIKRAYRKLASQHHPDRGGDTARFQEIQSAYDTLSDPAKRQQYDNPQPQGQHFEFNFGPGGMDEIFSNFFRGQAHPFQHARQQPRRNKDIRAQVAVGLQETLGDAKRTLNIKGANGSNQTVDITIPRGVSAGTTIKYPGLGDSLFENLPRGDLYLTVNIYTNPNFEVSGLDLITNLTIDSFDAILGNTVNVVGLDGKVFTINTPKFCQHGVKLKIPGEGLYKFQQDVKGNLYVRVNVKTPVGLTEQQFHALEQIRQQLAQ